MFDCPLSMGLLVFGGRGRTHDIKGKQGILENKNISTIKFQAALYKNHMHLYVTGTWCLLSNKNN